MQRHHVTFGEQDFVGKSWNLQMESSNGSSQYPETQDLQDFNVPFSDDPLTFSDLDSTDLHPYMSEETTSPDVTSTLSPYPELNSFTEVSFAVEHSNTTAPSINPYLGDYNFEVTVQKQTKETKSVNWIYSEDLRKLYVRINVPCPILFQTCPSPPAGSVIRATPIFNNPQHVNEVVKRCPTHMAQAGGQNEPRSQWKHLLTSDHREASHVENPITKRLCVVIPHEDPQVGSTWVTSLFRFMCFSSCHGGYSKRPLHVIFTLEYENKVLGRQVVPVRLCACPGRDWDIETRPRGKKRKPTPQQTTSRGDTDPRPVLGSGKGVSQPVTLVKASTVGRKRRSNEKQDVDKSGEADKIESDEVFTLQVKGQVNYNILRKLRDSLHLFCFLPEEVINRYSQERTEDTVFKQTSSDNDNQFKLPRLEPTKAIQLQHAYDQQDNKQRHLNQHPQQHFQFHFQQQQQQQQQPQLSQQLNFKQVQQLQQAVMQQAQQPYFQQVSY